MKKILLSAWLPPVVFAACGVIEVFLGNYIIAAAELVCAAGLVGLRLLGDDDAD